MIAGYNGTILKTLNGGGVIPVELISFNASLINSSIELDWTTATEINNYGFNIERSTNKKDWDVISFIQGNGTTTEVKTYSFIDNISGINSTKLYYRLKQIDYDGRVEYSDIVEVELISFSYELSQNYPNPFNPACKIRFSLSEANHVVLKVFNSLGQEVSEMVNKYLPAGIYEHEFSGENFTSGIYFYKIVTDDFVEIKKMNLIK